MDTFYKTLPKRHSTKETGIYYKEIEKTTVDDKGSAKTIISDKVFLIRYTFDKKPKWVTLGKYSAGVRLAYCVQKRNEIISKLRIGEEPPAIIKRKRKSKADVITVDDVFSHYIGNKDMAERTRKDFQGRYEKHFSAKIGDLPADELTAEKIMDVRENMKSDYKEKTAASAKTKEVLIQILGAAFNYSIVNKYQTLTNPIARVRALDKANLTKKAKKEKRTQREEYLKRNEIEQLRLAVKDDYLSRLTVEILLSTGVRIGGALTIQKKDVDLDEGTVKLIDHKSGGDTYTGYISKTLKMLLVEHLSGLGRNDYVLSLNGTQTPYKTIMRPLKRVLDGLFNTGLDTKDSKSRIVLHSLRHSFASHLALQNVPLYTIKELMHHADISMTLRYAKLSKKQGQKAVMELGL